jgi:hypothetical protein
MPNLSMQTTYLTSLRQGYIKIKISRRERKEIAQRAQIKMLEINLLRFLRFIFAASA